MVHNEPTKRPAIQELTSNFDEFQLQCAIMDSLGQPRPYHPKFNALLAAPVSSQTLKPAGSTPIGSKRALKRTLLNAKPIFNRANSKPGTSKMPQNVGLTSKKSGLVNVPSVMEAAKSQKEISQMTALLVEKQMMDLRLQLAANNIAIREHLKKSEATDAAQMQPKPMLPPPPKSKVTLLLFLPFYHIFSF